MKRFVRRLTRRLRMASFAPLAWWAWRYRNDLRRAVPLLKSVPQRLKAGQTKDLLTEAKVLRALAMDPRTRGNSAIELCDVTGGVARMRLSPRSQQEAVSVVAQVPGVSFVDVDPGAPRTAKRSRGNGHTVTAELDHLPEPAFA